MSIELRFVLDVRNISYAFIILGFIYDVVVFPKKNILEIQLIHYTTLKIKLWLPAKLLLRSFFRKFAINIFCILCFHSTKLCLLLFISFVPPAQKKIKDRLSQISGIKKHYWPNAILSARSMPIWAFIVRLAQYRDFILGGIDLFNDFRPIRHAH